MPLYLAPGLVISSTLNTNKEAIRALQADLRRLGYLHSGVDGAFGHGTESAVRAFQYDLLHNDGQSSGGDGPAPVAVSSFNHGAAGPLVTAVTGVCDQATAACLAAMVADARVPKLPASDNPAAANQQAMAAVLSHASTVCPALFLAAVVQQESGGKHYCEPQGADQDNVITIGLDRNGPSTDCISSRGYGLGQYTLFHHPPRADEVTDFMVDALQNVEKARRELRQKLDSFVAGPADHADDRLSEAGKGPVRLCRYAANDARYLRDCAQCTRGAKRLTIDANTPWYAGSPNTYTATPYHPTTHYSGVPDRSDFGCDWPYAVRRYNGSGVNSFHYQAEVLLILARLASQTKGDA